MKRLLFETVETVLIALTVVLVLQTGLQSFRVEQTSMKPTLVEGQLLLVNKVVYSRFPSRSAEAASDGQPGQVSPPGFLFHPPQRGEIIVFRAPGEMPRDLVKRVVAVAGDSIAIARGQVYLNGVILDEPYLGQQDRETMPTLVVPPGHYFVMGDNRAVSLDSRHFGPVPLESIVGKAWLSYWPLASWGTPTGS